MKNGSPFQGLRTWLLCIYKNSKGGWGKAEDEKNDQRIPRESMERDSELENATLPQQIKKERKKSRDLHP